MKKLCALSASLLMVLFTAHTAQAWTNVVVVLCDVNGNSSIDPADTPVQGVNVGVTNIGGTFVATGTTAADGSVVFTLPFTPDSYVDFIQPPAGTTAVIPGITIPFSVSSTDFLVTNYFLIQNPVCSPVNDCWLTGGGTIGASKEKPDFSFGGVVYPGCKATASDGGNWNVVDHVNRLHFKATGIQVVQCGNLPQYPSGSTSPKTPNNYIDFQGSGTLKGIGGNTADFGPVFFYARALDLGEPGKGVDKFYLQVYDGNGKTLLLISADADTPDHIVAPVTIRSGNLQLHSSGCDKLLKRARIHKK